MRKKKLFLASLIPVIIGIIFLFSWRNDGDDRFISYIADASKQDIAFYWKDSNEENFKSIDNLRLWLEKNNRELVFAMNGGMYKPDNSPQGLYIENGKELFSPDTSAGNGNFYMKPNGIFFITDDNKAVICRTEDFHQYKDVKFATQSGPMLVIDGNIHPAFKQGSQNMNVRNGVGILPDNKLLFAMSKKAINFYDFAEYFKLMGCSNALYLDGFVSRTYLPEKKWIQTDGNFGVIIGISRPVNK